VRAFAVYPDFILNIGIESVSVVQTGEYIVGNLVILKARENDEYAGGDAKALECNISLRRDLQNAEEERQRTNQNKAVSELDIAYRFDAEFEDACSDCNGGEGEVLQCEAEDSKRTSDIDIILSDAEKATVEDVDEEQKRDQGRGKEINRFSSVVFVLDMENNIEKEIEKISHICREKNAEDHGDVAQKCRTEELAPVKNIARQIGNKRPCNAADEALEHASSVRVVLIFESMLHVNDQKQTKSKVQEV
jgi:hypothetical protein